MLLKATGPRRVHWQEGASLSERPPLARAGRAPGGGEERRTGRGRAEQRKTELRLGPLFGLFKGLYRVHFSTAAMTNPRNESLRETPLRNDCLGPSGLGSEAWKRA